MVASIFLDFNLPNATTWFYFSLLLGVALFFQFARVLTLRNWDLLALFLLAPGFLILQEGKLQQASAEALGAGREPSAAMLKAAERIFCGYLWLLSVSAVWFGRLLVDLALSRRPAGNPNLNLAGLAWFGLALYVSLCAVAAKRASLEGLSELGKKPEAIVQMGERARELVMTAEPSIEASTSPEAIRLGVEVTLALACHFAVLVGVVLIGGQHFGDWTNAAAMATLYLLLPYTAMHIGQLHHVWSSAFLVWALYSYRRPGLAGLLLGLAAGSAFLPLLLVPLWVGFYWQRGAGRFTLAFAAATALALGITSLMLWLDGRFFTSINATLHLADWQAWRAPQTESIWTGAHWAYRLPIFMLYLGFILAVAFWPTPKNLAHLIALSAAVLIGVQFWYADRGGIYVLWYLPLLILVTFRPNLSSHRPPLRPQRPSRFLRWLRRRIARSVSRQPSPPAPTTTAATV